MREFGRGSERVGRPGRERVGRGRGRERVGIRGRGRERVGRGRGSEGGEWGNWRGREGGGRKGKRE